MKLEYIEPEHLERIERFFHAALERDANEREAFLAEACAGDESLRGAVLSLLTCDARADNFIEAPAFKVTEQLRTEEQESLMIGRRLGPYQILDLIGAGGMGEVYRAMDTRLGREAISEMRQAMALRRHDANLSYLGYIFAVAGRKSEALKILREMEKQATRRRVSPVYIARIYTGFGDNDRALEWLRKGYDERSDHMLSLGVNPIYDGLRSDPRFVEMLRGIGLAR